MAMTIGYMAISYMAIGYGHGRLVIGKWLVTIGFGYWLWLLTI
jgi:hypothetical protein